MNPQEQEHAPSFELPAAQSTEQAIQSVPELKGAERTEKQSSIAVEHAAAQQSPPPPPSQFPDPQGSVGQSTPPATNDTSTSTLTNTPPVAEDTDLIEKEWVVKAKEIVARTAHDPHLQNKEMNRFKADYLKKRYNKDIKLSED